MVRKTLASAVAPLVQLARATSEAQALQSYRISVSYDNVRGVLQLPDNPLPPVVAVNQNGAVHLAFQATSHTIANYTATVTGPQSTIPLGFTAATPQGPFAEAVLQTRQLQAGQPTPFLNSGNFLNPGISLLELTAAFPTPGLYRCQFTITGLRFDNSTLDHTTLDLTISVSDKSNLIER